MSHAEQDKAARLEDCGQSSVCELSPGCVRHFIERNAELVKERDEYKTRLAHAEVDAEQAVHNAEYEAAQRVAAALDERNTARSERDEARAELEHAYRENGALYEAKIAQTEAEKERDEARADRRAAMGRVAAEYERQLKLTGAGAVDVDLDELEKPL